MSNKVIICKESDSMSYEVWKKLYNTESGLDFEYIDMFGNLNEAIQFCTDNNFEIQSSYGEKQLNESTN